MSFFLTASFRKHGRTKLHIGRLLGAILVCEAAGIVGALFTVPQIPTWYQTLAKPEWNPPAAIFGPVWTILFLLMGIALYLVWQTGLEKRDHRLSSWLFIAHLIVNFLWSVVFFGLQSPVWGVIVIVMLLAYILYLVYRFWQINYWAGILLVPYAVWVTFATFLNYTIWTLNK